MERKTDRERVRQGRQPCIVNLHQLLMTALITERNGIAGIFDQRRLPGICQEKEMHSWLCVCVHDSVYVSIKRGEFSEGERVEEMTA